MAAARVKPGSAPVSPRRRVAHLRAADDTSAQAERQAAQAPCVLCHGSATYMVRWHDWIDTRFGLTLVRLPQVVSGERLQAWRGA